jgi:predicted protein tyrosine phosphatase
MILKLVRVYRRGQMKFVEPEDSVNLISIWSLNFMARSEYGKEDVPMEGWNDVIKLEFDDIVSFSPKMKLVPFDTKMADDLLSFIEVHEGEEFVVHCDAGMSRSVAVACFLRDDLGYDADLYAIDTDKYRNVTIMNALRRAHYGMVEKT